MGRTLGGTKAAWRWRWRAATRSACCAILHSTFNRMTLGETLGGTKAAWRWRWRAAVRSACCACSAALAARRRSGWLRKYSPLSSCRSTCQTPADPGKRSKESRD